jgi:hypothetical protein
MRLLHTHAFIRWDSDPAKLSAVALAALRDPANVEDICPPIRSSWI